MRSVQKYIRFQRPVGREREHTFENFACTEHTFHLIFIEMFVKSAV